MDTSLTLLAEKLNENTQSHLHRLEFLVNTSPVVIHTRRAEGDFATTYITEGVRNLWGYQPDEFLKDSGFWNERVHPEDLPRVLDGLALVSKFGLHSHEFRFRTSRGEYRWVRDDLRLLRNPAGGPLEIAGHCSDITELKMAEAARRESEARLALIFNSTSDFQVLFRVEPDNRFITEAVNRALSERFHATTGQEISSFVGQGFEEILAVTGILPDEIEERRGLYQRVVREKAIVRFSAPPSPLREAVEISISPVIDEAGRCTHVLWNARTLTERVIAEAALRESEERYALVSKATLDGIFDWNVETGHSHLSPRFKEILGYRDHELPNDSSSFFSRVHPEDAVWLNELVIRMHADRNLEMFEHELRLQRRDGGYCLVLSRGLVIRNSAGLPARFIGAIHDITERKRSEDALAFLASIVQSSEDTIVGTNLNGTILSWNGGSEHLWGYTAEEAIGKNISILFPAERNREYADSLEKIKNGKFIERFESLRTKKDGTIFSVSVILSPIRDSQGRLLGASAIYHDMTERDEAEARLLAAKQAAEVSAASLRESEERYALAIQATRDGIYDWNVAAGQSYHSPQFKEILGFSGDELPDDPSSFFDRLHPDDRARMSEVTARNAQDKTVDSFEDEMRVQCKDGRYRWVVSGGRLMRDADGNATRIIGSIRDITERKEAEAKLAASEERLRDILDSLYGFVGIYTLEGAVIDVNRAPVEAFGIPKESLIGKPFWETHPWSHSAEERARLREMMARAAQGEVVRYEASVLMRNGQVIVDTTFGPLRDHQGRITSVIGFGVDVTARKEAEAKLLLAKQVAEVASRAKSEFLANMSHEIRTPMNGIIGLTEVVLESELTSEQREYLTLVKGSAESLMHIIGDILDISKIQAGKFVLHPKQFWLKDLITNTISGFADGARDKGLRLAYRIQPEIPDVLLGDPGGLKQILVNLLGNAIKFTSEGEVNLSVETSPESAGRLHFSVSDTGIGIPADQRRMIFEPFSQVDGSSRREFGGTGLGLAISAQLVEMMGGEMWVVSDGRAGSVFHFTANLAAVVTSKDAAPDTTSERATATGHQRNRAAGEARKFPRFETNDRATLKLLRPSAIAPLEAQVLNVSTGGLKLWLTKSLSPGTEIEIHRREDLAVVAEVRYCVPASRGFYVGVKLHDMFR